MKKLIIGLIALVSFAQGFGQSAGNDTTQYIYYRFTYGNALDRYWAKHVLMIPTDTIWSKDGIALKDGIIYVGNGISWSEIAGGSSVDSSIFATITRLADSSAALRGLISSGFDSATSQGGGFHTQQYNDIRYLKRVDSAGVAGYVTHAQDDSAKLNIRAGIKQADWTQATTTDPSYIKNKPTLGTAAEKNVPASGDAASGEVVQGNDSRLTDQRDAKSIQGKNVSSSAPSNGNAWLFNSLTNTWEPSAIPYPSILFRYNVVDYGADTTGANPTTTRRAIDSCLAAAMRSPLPATIVFPSGAYAIDSSLIDITKALALEGYNAYLKASNTNAFTFFKVKADSVRFRGMKFIGNSANQKGVDINGYKYFSVRDGEFSNLSVGMRFANTSSTYSAGDVDGCNFFNNTIGLFSDTLGEYVTVRGGLYKGNTVAIQDDGGNNIFMSGNSNSNTTAFNFTGGSNNSHGMIIGWNANHNTNSIIANGAIYGMTVVGGHFYEGNMTLNQCSNWRFTGQCIIGPSTLTITQCANIDFSDCFIDPTYGTIRNFSGNFNKPVFRNNMGLPNLGAGSATGTNTPFVDSLGSNPYRIALTGDTLDLGIARWWTKTLSGDDTIRLIIHPTAGRTYRLEVRANGHNFVLLDNTKISGTFNSAADLNVYNIECIDDGADPRFLVRVEQPGVLVSRNTTNLGWGRLSGTGSISGSNITKSGPDGNVFTVQAVPDKVLSSGDGYFSCQTISTYGNIVFGLSDNPSQTDYHSIDYGIYFFGSSGGSNNVNIAENGTLISTGIGSTNWSTNDSFRVKVTGTTVTYEKYSGGTWNIFYTSTHAVTTYPLIPQVSIRALTTFTNPRLFGSGVTNNLQSYYAVGYADNISAKNIGGNYQTVQSNGSDQTQRAKLNFISPWLSVTDNPGNNSTDIDVAVKDYGFYGSANGDGTTKDFTFGHGQTGITSSSPIAVTLRSADAMAGGAYWVETTSTNVIIHFSIAPPSGTNNVSFSYLLRP